MKPRALDLFCGGGGATKGLQRAGFHVTGVDINPQPNYCGDAFLREDASVDTEFSGYDFVWASPPCQRYSMFSRNLGTSGKHPDLIPHMRSILEKWGWGVPFVIENVPGSPLRRDLILCGSMFGLGVRRHRLFECHGFSPGVPPACNHTGVAIPVFGHGTPQWHRKKLGRNISIAEKREAMGISWMTRQELSQAIPPAYAEFIGREAMRTLVESPHANRNKAGLDLPFNDQARDSDDL